MPVGRPGHGSPEPAIPLLPAGSRQPGIDRRDPYGELESSASAEVPTARSRGGGGRLRLSSLSRALGRSGDHDGTWLRAGSLAPLLVGLLIGVLGTSILPPMLSSAPSYAPVPQTSLSPEVPSAPETLTDTVLNPWTRPGLIRNRPVLPVELVSKMGDAADALPWGLFNRVRWEPDPPDDIHPDYGQGGESLMEQLADASESGVAPAAWEWAVNKTILGIGDSLMRNNVNYFSMHVSNGKIGRKMLPLFSPDGTPWQDTQAMGTVDIPALNLKIANWFHQGMLEEEIPFFFVGENRPQDFESKLEHIFLPTLDNPDGLDGRTPDLIIFESLSWDLVFLAYLARGSGDQRYDGRPLDEIELEWARGRQVEVLRLLRKTFPTSKIVVQTPHLGSKSPEHVFSPIRKFQQAQLVRSLALDTGFELFDWGRIVSPLSSEMRDGLHFVAGAATWLWGEMVLSYLRRAHFHPVNIPPAPSPNAKKYTQKDLVASYKEPKIQYPHTGINDKEG